MFGLVHILQSYVLLICVLWEYLITLTNIYHFLKVFIFRTAYVHNNHNNIFWWCMFHWQIFKESVQWETSSRIESLQNAKHVPGGGNVKVGSEFSFCVPVRPFREQQTVNVGIEGFNLFTRIFWRKFRWWKWWLLFGRWAGWKALSVFDYLFCTTWSNYNTSQLFLLYLHNGCLGPEPHL